MAILNSTTIIKPASQLDITLNKLKTSTYSFYLTGSRFFGSPAASSDYDFFTEYTTDVEHWLSNSGFTLDTDKDYTVDDPYNICKLYRLGAVDVQLVINAEMKNRLQNLVQSYALLTNCRTKYEKKKLWVALYAILKEFGVK